MNNSKDISNFQVIILLLFLLLILIIISGLESNNKRLDKIELQCTPEIPLRSSVSHSQPLLLERNSKVLPKGPLIF